MKKAAPKGRLFLCRPDGGIPTSQLAIAMACRFGGVILLEGGEEGVMSRPRKTGSIDVFALQKSGACALCIEG